MEGKLGFIGLGNMGGPMAANLLKAGYSLVVHDIRPEAVEEAVKLGAEGAGSPGEVARLCPAVITILPTSSEVEEVVLGAGGIVEGASEGSVVIEMTTAYPGSTLEVNRALKERGIRMMDAPVSGGVKGAVEGTLSVMVGGDEELFREFKPMFETVGKNVFHLGDVGAGHTMKAINNFLSACSLIATSEAVVLAARAGMDPARVVELLQVSSGRSYSTEYKFPTFILPRKFDAGFPIKMLHKDLDILVRLGRELKVPMFVANMVEQMYSYACSQGKGDLDHTAIIRILEDWTGVEV
jgi:3-hydroxyisobutyrate dehydrogenase